MAVTEGTILRIVASMLFPDSVIAQNVFYAVLTAAGGSSTEEDVTLDMAEWLENLYEEVKADIISGISAAGVQVYEFDHVDDDWDEVGSDSWVHPFENVNEMAPHGVAAIIHAKTFDPDVQATKYLGGYSEAVLDASDLAALAITRLGTFGGIWTTPFVGTDTGATFTPGVWSVAQQNFFAFNGVSIVNGIVGYQRRRKPGVGI